jgi:hypothetical protein
LMISSPRSASKFVPSAIYRAQPLPHKLVLLDEHILHAVTKLLEPPFQGSIHVRHHLSTERVLGQPVPTSVPQDRFVPAAEDIVLELAAYSDESGH